MAIESFTSRDIPPAALAVVGIIIFLLAFKIGRMLFKLVFGLIALALLGGVVWWHLSHR